MSRHFANFEQHFIDNYLIISDKFIEIAEKFLSEMSELSDSDLSPPEIDEKYAELVGQYKTLLLEQGRREIANRRPRRGLWPFKRSRIERGSEPR
jgi:hypothetical protein